MSQEEMVRLTNKNYRNLPEVKQKRDEEQMKKQKKIEWMNRMKNVKDFELVLDLHLNNREENTCCLIKIKGI